ncbi:alpha/beta fold hydrolase [Bradyrhizobium sp. 2]|uniref:esterase/lipase family protein n=1 Tax=Bradyrhizobium sp. 2 TaxID=190045 RepID=UPI001FFA7619|nr:alpha/beta fold hydrolase [Bradyrhizobium sp. 2]MCK1457108.1 alpha/beta fold hydrolase [Bradyrhizobium sp. 2]
MGRAQTVEIYTASKKAGSQLDIVFVHGLIGSAKDTWACDSQPSSFWPKWLAEFGDVWIVDYPADLFWWSNTGMGLPERARSVVDALANYGLGAKPIIWVTHSLGGLLVKSMLRVAHELNNPNWEPVVRQTRGVVFLGTPHTGASLGTLADLLRAVASVNATQLKSNESNLLDLTSWYSRNAKRLNIRTLAYYEKGTVRGLKVVDEGSADPRVEDCVPVPSDANHMEICKPKDVHDPVYRGVLRFIETNAPPSAPTRQHRNANEADYNINTVFGIHRGDTVHYVQRTRVDDALIGQLIGGKHLCIYGSSKQGKTALRKKHIAPSDELCVVCDRSWDVADVFAALLKAAHCEVQRVTDDPASSLYSVQVSKGETPIGIDLSHTADFLRALQRSFAGKYLVIEEFHYLAEEIQRDLAFKLKAIHELSDQYVFIVIGVWLESNRLVHLNKDLTGRVAPINADDWSDADLIRVIHEGEKKLNIAFPVGFADKLVERACGSVYLVREACYRACEQTGIYTRQDPFVSIEQSINVGAVLREISESGVDYPGQILGLLGLEDIQLFEHEREEGLKDWVLRVLFCATAKDMRKGLPSND